MAPPPTSTVASSRAGRSRPPSQERVPSLQPVDETSLCHFGIKRAVEFIHEHHSATLDLEQAAAAACLSKYHFSRLFHRLVGISYQEYLTRIRVEDAKQLLKHTPYLSLTRIAVRVGLGSLRNFEGQFKKLTGQSPSEYRRTPLVPHA